MATKSLFQSDLFQNVGLNTDWSCSAILACPETELLDEPVNGCLIGRQLYVVDGLDLCPDGGFEYLFVDRIFQADGEDMFFYIGKSNDTEAVAKLIARLRNEPNPHRRITMIVMDPCITLEEDA